MIFAVGMILAKYTLIILQKTTPFPRSYIFMLWGASGTILLTQFRMLDLELGTAGVGGLDEIVVFECIMAYVSKILSTDKYYN